MVEKTDVHLQVDRFIERAEKDFLDASHKLAKGITKEADRYVPPLSADVERLVDEVFEFADRVLAAQRKMINELVRAINEQTHREPTTRPRGPGRRVAAKPAAKRTAKAAPKAAATKRAPTKAPSTRKSTRTRTVKAA